MKIFKASSLGIADVVLQMMRTIAPTFDEENPDEHHVLVNGFKNEKVSGYLMQAAGKTTACQVFGHYTHGQVIRITFGKNSDYDFNGNVKGSVTIVDYNLQDAHAAAIAIIQWICYGEIV